MAGYHNYSKSNNAVSAERAGRYPASKCAQLLGVPTLWVQRQRTTEWHHTSARYNITDYYDMDALQEHLETPEGQEQLAEVKAELAALKKAPERVWTGVEVRWVEWSGTRAHPKARGRMETGCTVTDSGGKFVVVTLPNGNTFRKGKNTNGFHVIANGKEVRF